MGLVLLWSITDLPLFILAAIALTVVLWRDYGAT